MPKKTANSQNSARMAKNRAVVVNGLIDRYYAQIAKLEKQARDAELWEAGELINETAVRVEQLHTWREISREISLVYHKMNLVREHYPTQWMTYHGIDQ